MYLKIDYPELSQMYIQLATTEFNHYEILNNGLIKFMAKFVEISEEDQMIYDFEKKKLIDCSTDTKNILELAKK